MVKSKILWPILLKLLKLTKTFSFVICGKSKTAADTQLLLLLLLRSCNCCSKLKKQQKTILTFMSFWFIMLTKKITIQWTLKEGVRNCNEVKKQKIMNY